MPKSRDSSSFLFILLNPSTSALILLHPSSFLFISLHRSTYLRISSLYKAKPGARLEQSRQWGRKRGGCTHGGRRISPALSLSKGMTNTEPQNVEVSGPTGARRKGSAMMSTTQSHTPHSAGTSGRGELRRGFYETKADYSDFGGHGGRKRFLHNRAGITPAQQMEARNE